MLSAISTLGRLRIARKNYQGQAAVARTNAVATRRAAYASAENTRTTARKNQEIAGQNIRISRENAAAAVSSVRAAQGASGLSTAGTGNTKIIAAQQALDAQIQNMATSASIAMSNAWGTAAATERQGEINAAAIESEAAAYSAAANSLKSGALISALGGIAATGYSLYNGLTQKPEKDENGNPKPLDTSAIALRALNAADIGTALGATYNPYAAALTDNPNNRKMNWSWLTAINNGNIPYNPDLQNSYFPRTY